MAMESYFMSFFTIFAVVVLILHQADAESDGDLWRSEMVDGKAWQKQRMSVTIKNELPDILEAQCHSKDDNLGLHYLQPWIGLFSFPFHSNLWGSTEFWCTFTHGHGAQWNSFPVWTDTGLFGRKKRPCEQCVWIARPDSFYRAPVGGLPIATQPWRNTTQP